MSVETANLRSLATLLQCVAAIVPTAGDRMARITFIARSMRLSRWRCPATPPPLSPVHTPTIMLYLAISLLKISLPSRSGCKRHHWRDR